MSTDTAHRRLGLLGLVLAPLALGACSLLLSFEPAGKPCGPNGKCLTGYVCQSSVCMPGDPQPSDSGLPLTPCEQDAASCLVPLPTPQHSLRLFGLDLDSGISYLTEPNPGTFADVGWVSLSGILSCAPAWIERQSGQWMQVATNPSSGSVWPRVEVSNGIFNPPYWRSIAGADAFFGRPALAESPPGTAVIVGRQSDAGVLFTRELADGGWGAWQSLAFASRSDPTLLVLPTGGVQVFASALATGGVFENHEQAPGGSWAGWSVVGSNITHPVSAVVTADGGTLLVGVDATQSINQNASLPDGGWVGWTTIPGLETRYATELAVDAAGVTHLFAVSADGGTVWTATRGAKGWLPWTDLGLPAHSAPVALSDGWLEVFVLGPTASGISYDVWDGVSWSGWTDVGGRIDKFGAP